MSLLQWAEPRDWACGMRAPGGNPSKPSGPLRTSQGLGFRFPTVAEGDCHPPRIVLKILLLIPIASIFFSIIEI